MGEAPGALEPTALRIERLLPASPERMFGAWTPSVATVELTEEAGATRLVLTHERLPDEQVASHEDGWGSILYRLAAELSTDTEEGEG